MTRLRACLWVCVVLALAVAFVAGAHDSEQSSLEALPKKHHPRHPRPSRPLKPAIIVSEQELNKYNDENVAYHSVTEGTFYHLDFNELAKQHEKELAAHHAQQAQLALTQGRGRASLAEVHAAADSQTEVEAEVEAETEGTPAVPAKPAPAPVKPAAPAAANSKLSTFISSIKAKLGAQYVYGASGPTTFDCSGLVYWAAHQAGLTTIPRTAAQQYTFGTAVTDTTKRQLGDLIFFGKPNQPPYHVGIWIAPGQMIDAPHTGAVVRQEAYTYWPDQLTTARRIF